MDQNIIRKLTLWSLTFFFSLTNSGRFSIFAAEHRTEALKNKMKDTGEDTPHLAHAKKQIIHIRTNRSSHRSLSAALPLLHLIHHLSWPYGQRQLQYSLQWHLSRNIPFTCVTRLIIFNFIPLNTESRKIWYCANCIKAKFKKGPLFYFSSL